MITIKFLTRMFDEDRNVFVIEPLWDEEAL